MAVLVNKRICQHFTAACFVVSCLLFFYNAFRRWTYLEDDPLIVFRYAMNFHAGHGWVANPGEHVAGCTSALLLGLDTFLSSFLSLDSSIVALKILGLLCGMAVLGCTVQIARFLLPEAPLFAALAPLLVAYRSDFSMAMLNGLETPYACAFLLCGLIAFQYSRECAGRGCSWAAVAFFVGAGLSRPELAVVYPALCVLRLVRKEPQNLRSLALYLLPFLGCAAFSLSFYHSLLPNTYFAKHSDALTMSELGSDYISRFLLSPTSVLAPVFSDICLASVLHRRGRFTDVFVLTVALHLVFLLNTCGDWMVDGRLAMPILPLVAVSWLVGAHTYFQSLSTGRMVSWRALAAASAALLLFAVFMDNSERELAIDARSRSGPFHKLETTSPPLSEWMCGAPDGRRRMADWIQSHVRPGETVATPEMGLIACLNPGVRFIDLKGLTDSTIANLPNYTHNSFGVLTGSDWQNLASPVGKYIDERAPAYVISVHYDGPTPGNPKYVKCGQISALVDQSGWLTFAIYKRK